MYKSRGKWCSTQRHSGNELGTFVRVTLHILLAGDHWSKFVWYLMLAERSGRFWLKFGLVIFSLFLWQIRHFSFLCTFLIRLLFSSLFLPIWLLPYSFFFSIFQVAVKTIKKTKIQSSPDERRVQREITIAKLLNHNNIITVHDGKLKYSKKKIKSKQYNRKPPLFSVKNTVDK